MQPLSKDTRLPNNTTLQSWNILFNWVNLTREIENKTIVEFLGSYDIPITVTNIQFLCGDGSRYPSSKSGTIGRKLRDHIARAQKNGQTNPKFIPSLEYRLLGDCLENERELAENFGIFNIEIHEKFKNVEVSINDNFTTTLEPELRKRFDYIPQEYTFDLQRFRDTSSTFPFPLR